VLWFRFSSDLRRFWGDLSGPAVCVGECRVALRWTWRPGGRSWPDR